MGELVEHGHVHPGVVLHYVVHEAGPDEAAATDDDDVGGSKGIKTGVMLLESELFNKCVHATSELCNLYRVGELSIKKQRNCIEEYEVRRAFEAKGPCEPEGNLGNGCKHDKAQSKEQPEHGVENLYLSLTELLHYHEQDGKCTQNEYDP